MKYLSFIIYGVLAVLTLVLPMIFIESGNQSMAEAILLAWPAIIVAFVFASLGRILPWRARLGFRIIALAVGLTFYTVWGVSASAGFFSGVIVGGLLLVIAFAAEQLRDEK